MKSTSLSSSIDQGGGKRRSDVGIAIATLIGDEYLAEPESFCNRSGHICFSAIQKPIDLNAINSVLPCKVGLASFPTNRGPQQLNNVTACFVVIDSADQKPAYVYFEDERGPALGSVA